MSEVELRDAATVLILRDGQRDADGDALEVFMLRRNLNSDFVGGAYVFPGGAVDPEDRHADLDAGLRGPHRRRGVSAGSASTGRPRLLGRRHPRELRGGRRAARLRPRRRRRSASTIPDTDERFAAHRAAVDTRPAPARRDLRGGGPAARGRRDALLQPLDHARGAPRRYDTRFFVALAPPAQTPCTTTTR